MGTRVGQNCIYIYAVCDHTCDEIPAKYTVLHRLCMVLANPWRYSPKMLTKMALTCLSLSRMLKASTTCRASRGFYEDKGSLEKNSSPWFKRKKENGRHLTETSEGASLATLRNGEAHHALNVCVHMHVCV